MDISAYLTTAIRRKKITQRAFAAMIEVTPAYLNKLCKGTKTPSIDLLDKICVALDMSPSQFFSSSSDLPLSLSPEETSLVQALRTLPDHEKHAIAQLIHALNEPYQIP